MISVLDQLKGKTLGQYQLIDLLGVGGMGAVYQGYQESLQREVAVKVIFTPDLMNTDGEARFQREAQTAASLEHAHIVPVYDYGTDQGISYVVMRLLGGGSLADRISAASAGLVPHIPLPEVAQITRDLAIALQYAHKRDVIHRDIKANNVMFDDQGTVFLVDFGIAMMAGAGTRLTNTGVKIGTPMFMAPEQWRNEPVTVGVDQYALAILVYHMLTGESPFKGDMPFQLMHSHLHEAPTPLNSWRMDLPHQVLMPVLERAMQKTPQARYPDIETFAQAFSDAVAAGPDAVPELALQSLSEGGRTLILPESGPPVPASAAALAQPRSRRLLRLALIPVLLTMMGLVLALAARPESEALAVDLSETSTQLAMVASETALALAAHVTDTATPEPSPTLTDTAAPSETPAPTLTHTATVTDTEVPTDSPSPTSTSTEPPTATEAPSATPMSVAMLAGAVQQVSFTLPLTAMQTGETGIVQMEVACPAENCDTVDMTIQFDADIIHIDRIDMARSLLEPVSAADNRIDNEVGVIRLIAAAVTPGTLATQEALDETNTRVLQLHVKALQPGTSPLQVAKLYVFDRQGQALEVVSIDGGVFVSGERSLLVSDETCTYRVQSGDTLSAIAVANGVTVEQINELNEIPNQSVIRVGQELIIPAGACRAPSQVRSVNNGNSQIFDVYDCRHLGNNVFEWYTVRVDYDSAGNPTSETRLAGPYSGAWQPGCPGGVQSSNGGSSNNGNSGSSGGGGGGGSQTGGGDDDDEGGGGLGGVICSLLC